MTPLPVRHIDGGQTAVVDPSTGEMVALRDASDRALAHAAAVLAEYDRNTFAFRRAVAAELRHRHGVGKVTAGGYAFTVAESQSWPLGATKGVLEDLVAEGVINEAEMERCIPVKPRPDPRQLKALVGRLTVSDPDAARRLARACTLSPPSLRDVVDRSVDATTVADTTTGGRIA